MADVAVVTNHFACITDVFAIMATKTTGRIEMADVVWVSRPVGFHLGEKICLEDPLRFADCCFNRIRLLRIQLAIIGPIKPLET